jgi:hypothetical protein
MRKVSNEFLWVFISSAARLSGIRNAALNIIEFVIQKYMPD